MAKDNSGGALGWTVLGFLAGVAATLGVQILTNSGQDERPSPAVAASSGSIHITGSASAQTVKPKKAALLAPSAASTPDAQPAVQPAAEVADDAAAAGMTSRVAPAAPPATERTPASEN
jgi:cytoskeletal protein RodZ